MTDTITPASALRECRRILEDVRVQYEDDTPVANDIDVAVFNAQNALSTPAVANDIDVAVFNAQNALSTPDPELARQTAIAVDLYARCEDLMAGLSLALSVALDCTSRWSRGHPERVQKAAAALTRAQAGGTPPARRHGAEALQRAEDLDARLVLLRASLQSLLDTQPPPVVGDYSCEDEEDAAIDARDATRDWYKLQLEQVLEGLKG